MALSVVRRPDFSNSLIHLTRDRQIPVGDISNFSWRTTSAFDALKSILAEGILRGGTGYIKGSRRAVCMSEIPLSTLEGFVDTGAGRYSHYGVAMSKKAAFAVGARPVLYLPDNEGDWIPADENWRHVRFEHGEVDFTHEREWRLPGDLELAKITGIYVLVWSTAEADQVRGLSTPLRNIRGVLAMEHLYQML
jgi:hypothetical protein